jgi:energy-coupling factor transporter ATP-binding protein EcfA2
MILKKAENSTPLIAFLTLCIVLICSLACGGGGQTSNNGVLELELSGSIDESTFPSGLSKPKRAPGTFTGLVTNLDDPQETWPLTFSSSQQFSANIIRKNNLKIEIFIGTTLVLSRVFDIDESNVSSLDTNINTMTHLQAQMVLEQINQNSLLSVASAKSTVNFALFGKSELEASDYNISLLAQQNPAAAVIMSTYAQLFNFSDFNLIRGALQVINNVISTTDSTQLRTNYLNTINALSSLQDTIATTIATAHESVKNDENNPIDVNEYASISSEFSLAALTAALESVRVYPTFPDLDSPNSAGVGVLFSYHFPAATTIDRQGLHSDGYQGIWLSTPPSGLIDTSGNGGLNLKLIPSSEDLGETFEYQVSIKGANNAGPVSTSLQFTVNSTEIIPKDRKRIFDQPIAGPVLDDDYLYLVSTGDDGYFLDKYPLSEIQTDGGATFLSVSRWLLPSGFTDVRDMALGNDLVYLTGGYSGVLAFDKNFSSINESEPTHSNNIMIGSDITIYQEQVFALQKDFTPVLHQAELDLSDSTEINTLEDIIIPNGNIQIATFSDDYLYISGNSQPAAYSLTTTSKQLALVDEASPDLSSFIPLDDAQALSTPLALFDNSNIERIDIIANTFTSVSSRTYTADDLNNPMIGNGTFFYTTHPITPTLIVGNSLTVSTFSGIVSQTPDEAIYYNSVSENLKFMIRNIPEGIETGKSGAWMYTIGAGDDTEFDEGFIRAYQIQPTP